jgi:hypothetical protein
MRKSLRGEVPSQIIMPLPNHYREKKTGLNLPLKLVLLLFRLMYIT